MSVCYVVCEGTFGGRDYRLLSALLGRLVSGSTSVSVEPAGNSRGVAAVADYVAETRELPTLSVRDRDFDFTRDQADERWRGGGTHLVWRRFEIENYLLDPRVVGKALTTIRDAPGTHAPGALDAAVQEPAAVLADVARVRLDHHAGQLCQHWLWACYAPALRRLRDLGDAPGVGGDWASWLEARTRELLALFAPPVADLDAEVARVHAKLAEFTAEACDPDFISSGRFLCDMPGKELLGAVADRLNRGGLLLKGGSQLSADTLGDLLMEALLAVYQSGFFAPDDDFAELADRLR